MKRKSYFDGEEYKGYKISLRIIRESIDEYDPVVLSNPDDVYNFMKDIQNFDRERLYSICLDSKNQVIHCEEISSGTQTYTAAHPREVFKSAILSSSSGIILTHNHPSGDPKPSMDDYQITEKFCKCGDLLEIYLLDHVIIGMDSYYSFKESGVLDEFCTKDNWKDSIFKSEFDV